MASARKIIIDTDPGQDDAAAIMLAFGSPDELELLGITTVAGNVPLSLTSRNARIVCELCGQTETKVFAGADAPIARKLVTAEHVHGKTGLDGPHLSEPTMALQTGHAVDFIIETLRREEEGTVTLCTLGPLTNIGLALQKAPDIAPRIRELVMMGGGFFEGGNITPAAEFNIYVDPEAADIVFRSGVPIVMMPLDVTHQLLTRKDRVKRMSFDLIYARPHQTVEQWERELKQAISYAVDHLSLYQLTIEEGTPFYGLHKAGKLIVPDGEQSAVLYEATQEITAREGMERKKIKIFLTPPWSRNVGSESRGVKASLRKCLLSNNFSCHEGCGMVGRRTRHLQSRPGARPSFRHRHAVFLQCRPQCHGDPRQYGSDRPGRLHAGVDRGLYHHAGTTPMDRRADALVAASQLVLDIRNAAAELSKTPGHFAATVGEFRIEPNAANVVPSKVVLLIDGRAEIRADMLSITLERDVTVAPVTALSSGPW